MTKLFNLDVDSSTVSGKDSSTTPCTKSTSISNTASTSDITAIKSHNKTSTVSSIKKDNVISIAKGICIILMVVCHAGCPNAAFRFIYMFHMPLFFFASGYCFNNKYLSDTSIFIKRRIQALYFPFVKYSLLFLLLHNIFMNCNIYNTQYVIFGIHSYFYGIADYIKKAMYIFFSMESREILTGQFWFFKQLLLGSFILLFSIKYCKNRPLIPALICLSISLILKLVQFNIPYININYLLFLSSFFMLIGAFLRNKNYKTNTPIFIIIVGIVFMGSRYFFAEMVDCKWTNMIQYSICAILGIIMVLNISAFIDRAGKYSKKLLTYIGNNTMPIFIWHFLCFKIITLLIIYIEKRPITQLAYFPVIPFDQNNTNGYFTYYWPLYALVGIGLPLLIQTLFHYVKRKITEK